MPTTVSCLTLEKDGKSFADMSYEEAKDLKGDKFCWCIWQDFSDLFYDSEISDFCGDYIYESLEIFSVEIISALLIVAGNTIVEYILLAILVFERHWDINKFRGKIMNRMTFVLSMNTALITLLVSLECIYIPFTTTILLSGDYTNFERGWYVKIGPILLAIASASLLYPHLFTLFVVYPCSAIKRAYCWKKYRNQYDLNKAFLGSEFNISPRLAEINSMVFLCYMYSGGIPLLAVICFFAVVVIYWTDKVLLFRYYRKPPYMESNYYLSSIIWLHIIVICHCIVTLLMYGCSEIFPRDEVEVSGRKIELKSSCSSDRFDSVSGYVYIALIVISSILLLYSVFAIRLFKRRIKKSDHNGGTPGRITFNEYLKGSSSSSLKSYRIKKNMKYAGLVRAMNELSVRTRQMSL